MQSLQYRNAIGPEDAPAFIGVHDACRETDQVRSELCFEYVPDVEGYRTKLAHTDPRHWIVVHAGAEVIGYGYLLSSWGEQNGK